MTQNPRQKTGSAEDTDYEEVNHLLAAKTPWWGDYDTNRKVILLGVEPTDYQFVVALLEMGANLRALTQSEQTLRALRQLWPKGQIEPYTGHVTTHYWRYQAVNESAEPLHSVNTVYSLHDALAETEIKALARLCKQLELLADHAVLHALAVDSINPVVLRAYGYDVFTMNEKQVGWYIARKELRPDDSKQLRDVHGPAGEPAGS